MASKREVVEKIGVVNHMVGIARHMRREQEAAADANVGRILAMLRIKDGISTREMGMVLGVDSEAMGTTLESMVASGLVELSAAEGEGPKSVTLTEKGRDYQAEAKELSDVALDGFGDEDVDALMGLLERIETSLTGEIGADWREREEERKAKKFQKKGFDRGGRDDRGGRGFRGGRDDRDRGGRGFRGGRDDRDRGGRGFRGGRDDRGGRGFREDRGGRDDRGGFRGGNRGGRDDRGGFRGGNRRRDD
ncbi:MarR family winged helix-turn-helix transcriptional regulator [Parafannyhessea umbonata]|uniref:DNA-binding transcriptional regulator, MarR family n=1 Tax=Parafannyhessea umbonata TaxID=604330 RepID=A0A1H9P737_9ACTN|nr:MarR family winged helix-turn-helix transcriptional regulator [Parafannyhessea umbonata]SER43393.1 DNA-binding transcriptional regulator, MarR family [Parafannyhessea umbonata]